MADGTRNRALRDAAAGAEPVAIIGMACMFPQAPDLRAFWSNIVRGVDAITQPVDSWGAGRYVEAGRIKTALGGYLRDLYRFDPSEFGIMPSSLDGGEPDQFLALKIARDALADAGYLRSDFDHRDTGIVLGHSTYLHRGQGAIIQRMIVVDQTMELLQLACPDLDEAQRGALRAVLEKRLPPSSSDVAPGLVPNVMTGRIANRLNLKGPNYLIDAACSSSLLAVNAAIDELRTGRSRLMLAGGVNASLPAEVSVIFTQLGALSGRGKVRPFEAGSDGTLLGEGLGVVVLKRLDDAVADGDRIYAVIRGVGQASDGRGQGLLAPSTEGESLSIQRAYASCGVEPSSIGMIEAHGTGIPLGDKTEIAALRSVFGTRQGAAGSIALGSVKSMISHCIPAAGIAGLIKSALALQHRLLPPTLCESVNPELGIEETPFYINTEARAWISPVGQPRRAGIDSFGFGGINTHAIVEEPPPESRQPERFTPWPAELCVFAADSDAALTASLQRVAASLRQNPDYTLAEVAASLAAEAGTGEHRLALVAKDTAGLAKGIEQALKKLQAGGAERWATRTGAVYSRRMMEGKLAFLFPGEGSQYLGMFADLAMCFDEVREQFDFWRGLYDDAPPGESRTDILFPPVTELSEARREALERRLHDMDVGSEAVFIGGLAMHSLLRSLGVEPDVMLGHSSGESSALAASGAIPADTPQQLAAFIRQLNAVYQRVLAEGKIPTGALLAVGALPLETIRQHIAAVDAAIVLAMDNCANQRVLYGTPASIATLQARLIEAGGICMLLPFDRGYHTPAFDAMSQAFLAYYRDIGLAPPHVELYSCASAGPFPNKATEVAELAAAQWSQTVRFAETVLAMHDDGVRHFVEVGPSGNLTAFVNDVLADRECVALASNLRRRSGMEQLLATVGQLWVDGRCRRLSRLYEARSIRPIELDRAGPAAPKGRWLDNTMPMIRLNEQDRAQLRALFAAEHGQQPVIEVAVAAPQPQQAGHTMEAPAAAPAPVAVAAGDGAGAEQALISEYFGLMRGFLAQQQRVVELLQASPVQEDEPVPAVSATPSAGGGGFIESVVTLDERHIVARCRLSTRQQFLRDHVLSGQVSASDPDLLGLSCVPFMASLEIMAQACAALTGRVDLQLIENVKAADWLALDDGELLVEVRAERIGDAEAHCRASILRDGRIVVSGNFRFAPVDLHAAALAPLSEYREPRCNGAELYQTGMFHGRTFQSLAWLDGWDDSGMDAQLTRLSIDGFFDGQHRPMLLTNPVLLDAVGQLAAFWIAEYAGTDFNCFPSAIERIELYRPCPADEDGMRLLGRQQPLDASGDIAAPRIWHFDCVDASGAPLVRVRGLVNVFFPVPNRFYEVRRDPLGGWLGEPLTELGADAALLWTLPHLADDFCSQSGGIFLRMLAHIYLSAAERSEWARVTPHPRRRREWLLGRAAIKEAVRYWVHAHSRRLLYPSDIEVLHDEHGAPSVDGWWRDAVAPAPQVSLSHDAHGCVAAVAAPHERIGVDVEDLGRIRNPEWLLEALAPPERAALEALSEAQRNDALLRLWCAKEAAAKYCGFGLQGRPEAFQVTFLDAQLQSAIVSSEHGQAQVEIFSSGPSIVAVARAPAVLAEAM